MATPSTTGSLALLIQHYRATHSSADMRAATLKALIIHAADECGDHPGPDYAFGWGLLNTLGAAELISRDQGSPDTIQELSLTHGQVIEQTFNHDGNGQFRATICWTDLPALPVAPALDPPDLMLINDLNLRVIGPGGAVHMPWVLNPANPAAAATRGNNFRDNVEMVVVDSAGPGAYKVQISYAGTLLDAPQDFALIVSGVDEPPCPPGEIADCNGNCAPEWWVGDGLCDDGTYIWHGVPIDFSCAEFDYDDGDCVPHDGPRIYWRHRSTGDNKMWLMNGATIADDVALPEVSDTAWQVVGTGNFNGQGNLDLLWRNQSTGKNIVWMVDGASVSSWGELPSVDDTNWAVVGTGDFDGDGKSDILWRHRLTGLNVVYLMNGLSVAEWGFLPPVTDLNWTVADTGDFDGDGRSDILWRHQVNGNNAIWMLNGLSVPGWGSLTPVTDLHWTVAGTGDFNDDGRDDIVWRNQLSGSNSLWFINGSTLIGWDALPSYLADVDWQIVGVGD